MKFAREDPREFVEYDYDKILLENIKQACTLHFKEKRNCDVLASKQEPTCTRLDQLPSLNLIFIGFTTPVQSKITTVLLNHGLYPLRCKKQNFLKTKQLRKYLSFPKVYLLST